MDYSEYLLTLKVQKSKNCLLDDIHPENCIRNNCTSGNAFIIKTRTKSNRYDLQHGATLPGNGVCV